MYKRQYVTSAEVDVSVTSAGIVPAEYTRLTAMNTYDVYVQLNSAQYRHGFVQLCTYGSEDRTY